MIDLVEKIARMNQVERIRFIRDLVTKWPTLASQLQHNIQIEIFEQREQREKQELERYSNMYDITKPLVLTKDMEVK